MFSRRDVPTFEDVQKASAQVLIRRVSPALPAITIALLLLALIFNRILVYRRLSHIPGPAWAGISRLWQMRACVSGRQHLIYGEMCQKYGGLARIGPNILITSDPDQIRRMCAPRSDYRRGEWYHAMRSKPGFDNILSEHDEERHDELRRKMAAGYAGKENPLLEETVDHRVLDFVQLIDRKYMWHSTSRLAI